VCRYLPAQRGTAAPWAGAPWAGALALRDSLDHVQHNVYFKEFPQGVPDTLEFWMSSLRAALLDPVAAESLEAGFIWQPDAQETGAHETGTHETGGGSQSAGGEDQPAESAKLVLGWLNLLSLPNYGRYQHTYEEMLAAHAELIPAVTDRVTVLHAGGTLEDEASGLYLSLAESTVPLSQEDLAALGDLALFCATGPQPETIPVRENRAVVNRVRLATRKPLIVDTVTDVLRLACAASDGDVTLEQPTKFRSFARPERRLLLAALDGVIAASPGKLGDVAVRREAWKRLGERLHPHEHPQWPQAHDVFAVARGEKRAPSFASQVERTMATAGAGPTARLLGNAPGLLWRSLDRLLREAVEPPVLAAVVSAATTAAPSVSGRVLLSVREHLFNRQIPTDVSRVFANRKGRAWTGPETREPLDESAVSELMSVIDAEVSRRLPDYGTILIDPSILGVALPLSGKAVAPGLGLMPRGSVSPIDGDLLRFFVYWKERSECTDYDLSALLLSDDFRSGDHVSWTNYHAGEPGQGSAVYSGDLTEAPDGATEFIDVELSNTPRKVIIPQVNIFSGEAFDQAEDAFFGFMVRSPEQDGTPFEARTVRMKSDLRGAGQIALPLARA
jgi:stress response protein SCP2